MAGTSDNAFQAEEQIVAKIADILDFEYAKVDLAAAPTTSATTDSIRQQLIPKFLYRLLPQALGFPSSNGEIELVCISSMSETIFWEYVREKLDLDAETLPKPKKDEATIQLQDLRGLGLEGSGSRCIKIVYSRQSWDAFKNKTPILQRDESSKHISRIYDAQELGRRLCAMEGWSPDVMDGDSVSASEDEEQVIHRPSARHFRLGYQGLYLWAKRNGILSQRLGLMTEEYLVMAYTHAYLELGESMDEDEMLRNVVANMTEMLTRSGRRLPIARTPEGARTIAYITEHAQSVGDSTASGLRLFVEKHIQFIKIETRCWAPKLRPAFADAVLNLLLQLQTSIRENSKGYHASIWPEPISESPAEGESAFLLGIYNSPNQSTANPELLSSIISTFFDNLTFDRSSASIDFSWLDKSEASELVSNLINSTSTQSIGTSSAPEKITTLSNDKVRTASQAMSRLRYDPTHASTDYEVAYVDRFEDKLMWKDLDKWQKVTEEEDFIPEHRVQMIRRKGDEFVVWDRSKRLDRTG